MSDYTVEDAVPAEPVAPVEEPVAPTPTEPEAA